MKRLLTIVGIVLALPFAVVVGLVLRWWDMLVEPRWEAQLVLSDGRVVRRAPCRTKVGATITLHGLKRLAAFWEREGWPVTQKVERI